MPGQKWCGIGLDIPTAFLSLQKSLCDRSHLICGVLSSFLLLKILFLFLFSVVPSPSIPHLPYPSILLILFKLSAFSLLVLIEFLGLACRYVVWFVSFGPSYEKLSVFGTSFSLPFIRTSNLKPVRTCSTSARFCTEFTAWRSFGLVFKTLDEYYTYCILLGGLVVVVRVFVR